MRLVAYKHAAKPYVNVELGYGDMLKYKAYFSITLVYWVISFYI